LSRSLSWALRHHAPSLGLKMSSDGYVPVDDLLTCGHPRFCSWTEEDVRRVVANNSKQRYSLKNDNVLCIRANQGHSIPGIKCEELLTPISPEELAALETIVHGTYRHSWLKHIQHEGLSRMKRNHIHFASGLPDGNEEVISGMRRTSEIYVFVDGGLCARDGIRFFRSDNGVILTAGLEGGMLPPLYFSKVLDAKTGDRLFVSKQNDAKPSSVKIR